MVFLSAPTMLEREREKKNLQENAALVDVFDHRWGKVEL
jgi:hypothetical protein